MQVEGKTLFEYPDEATAKKVARLLEIDNQIAPKSMRIRTWQDKNIVKTSVTSEKASTFFSTMDDLIFSEKLITNLMKIKVRFKNGS